jgi:glycosyltransferase involved in cell wall biosynthesis
MQKVLVILPVHNEEKNLPNLLPSLIRESQKIYADILAVNDASSDRSLQVLEQYGIPTLTHISQMGYGVTIQTGYKYAYRAGYEYAIQLDGDGQHDPRCLPSILCELQSQKYDIAIGSRFLPKDKIPFPPKGPLYYGTSLRWIGIHVFRFVLLCLCWRPITDPTSGYIGFNRNALHFLCGKSFPFDYPDADMIVTFLKNGLRLCEIPVYMYNNDKRHSLHRGCRPIWYVIKVFIAIFIASIRKRETAAF